MIDSWRNLSYARWRMHLQRSGADELVILLVYLDSYLFVTTTSILQVGVGVTANFAACEYLSQEIIANCAEPLRSCAYAFIARRR